MCDLLRGIFCRRRNGQVGVLVQVSQPVYQAVVADQGTWCLSCTPSRYLSITFILEVMSVVYLTI